MLRSIFFKTTLFLIVFILMSCANGNVNLDPQNSILGKWEITQLGNWPDMHAVSKPLDFEEFLQDSILRTFEYNSDMSVYKKYWIDDSLLYKVVKVVDGPDFVLRYRYKFSENQNILRLDLDALAIFSTSIYRRIK